MIFAMLWALACGDPGIAVVDREVGAACGSCVLQIPDARGCFWAVEIDGQSYPVSGVKPSEDMVAAHAEDGMCSVERKAIVSGSIRPDGRFLATEFELLPWDGSGRKAEPHNH